MGWVWESVIHGEEAMPWRSRQASLSRPLVRLSTFRPAGQVKDGHDIIARSCEQRLEHAQHSSQSQLQNRRFDVMQLSFHNYPQRLALLNGSRLACGQKC